MVATCTCCRSDQWLLDMLGLPDELNTGLSLLRMAISIVSPFTTTVPLLAGERSASCLVVGEGVALLSFVRSGGQMQSRQRRLQSPHLGFTSSHFFLRRLHMRHPVCTLRMRALGSSPKASSLPEPAAAPLESRGRHGRLRRTQRAQGRFPSQACLICAQRWHTGLLSEPMAVDLTVAVVGVCCLGRGFVWGPRLFGRLRLSRIRQKQRLPSGLLAGWRA